jgi:serine/threonine protein kinase/tetratricopeptide (TPR) repeat protein
MSDTVISHYRIIEKLGGGGMGVVYKAEDMKLDRIVALKFLPPELTRDDEAKKRFMQEAKTASSLDHTNICNIHEIDEADGQMFICMNYYEGETLKKKIDKGLMKIDETVDLALQIAKGLQKAHEKGIIHRDIKPANIFVTDDQVVKILDFGLAKLTGYSALTRVGETLGTTVYMSPEQSSGEKTDQRTDIWSLGVVLYEMVTGRMPFRGDYEQAVVYSIMNDEPEPVTGIRSNVPMELEKIIWKALRKKPSERYQHIDEMIVDLNNIKKVSQEKTTTIPVNKLTGKNLFFHNKFKFFTAALFIMITAYFLYSEYGTENVLHSEPTPIAVISFENQTGDNAFDYLQKAIPNLLITNLEQSKYFRVVTWERMQDLLRQMGKNDVKVIDQDLGFDICRREGVDIIVIGSYVKAGNTFATDIKVLDIATKQIIRSAGSRGEGISSILETQIDELSKQISEGAGISFSKIAAEKMKVIDVTTNSMEAYEYLLKGKDQMDKLYWQEARENFEKAIGIDSTFATAYLYKAFACHFLNEMYNSYEAIEKAYLYSYKTTEKERLFIKAFYSMSENNDEKRIQYLTELKNKYPEEKSVFLFLGHYYFQKSRYNDALLEFQRAVILDPDYHVVLNLMAYCYSFLGNNDKALECLREYSRIVPGDANPYDSMGEFYWRMGQVELAAEYFQKALNIKPDFGYTLVSMAFIEMYKENYSEADLYLRKGMELKSAKGQKAIYMWVNSFLNFWEGKIKPARENLLETRKTARALGNRSLEARSDWLQAFMCYEYGELDKVDMYLNSWYSFVKEYSTYTTIILKYYSIKALVNLKNNSVDSAKINFAAMQSLLPDWKKNKNLISIYNDLDAEILLSENKTQKAIKLLTKEYDNEIPGLSYSIYVSYNIPFFRDVLARAYIMAGQNDYAIAEYERLITRDNGKERYLVHPKHYYRLALLYEKKGLNEQAVKNYKRFLELWKNADPDLPEVIDAKKQLKKLSGS